MITTATTTNQAQPSKLLLGILTIGHLVNDFYGLVLPFLLPILIVSFKMDFFAAGLLALATNLAGGVLQPVAGYLADRYGIRKRIMIAGFCSFPQGCYWSAFQPLSR